MSRTQHRLSDEEVDKILESSGLARLETYKTVSTPLYVICEYGHVTVISLARVAYKGQRCVKCTGQAPKTQEEIEEICRLFGWTLLSLFYNYTEPLVLECSRGHVVTRSLGHIKYGNAECHLCTRRTLHSNETIDKWLDENTPYKRTTDFVRADKHIGLLCTVCGHEWSTAWTKIYNVGTKCPVCAKKNHPNWNRNLTPEQREKMRRNPLDDAWRDAVYERDDYTCLACGQKGGRLNAHHLYNVADYPDLRREVSNGVTLCRGCHAIGGEPHAFHRLCRFRKNTPEQFCQWLYYVKQYFALRDLAYV